MRIQPADRQLVERDIGVGIGIPPVHRRIRLQFAAVLAHEGPMRAYAQPRDDPAGIRPADARAVGLGNVVLAVVDIDELRLRLDHPVARQWDGIADFPRQP
ncbi:hypothetical protein D3C72_2064520 [compost metagenome]